jgi:hypothetical protein
MPRSLSTWIDVDKLRVGDALAIDDPIMIVELFRDEYGTWVTWDDGDAGYLSGRRYRVYR